LHREAKKYTHCIKPTFFIFDTEIYNLPDEEIPYVKKHIIDGKWIDKIGTEEFLIDEPCFKMTEDVRHSLKS
jgi:hypothetical protein